MKKAVKSVAIMLILMILLPSICLGADTSSNPVIQDIYDYLYKKDENGNENQNMTTLAYTDAGEKAIVIATVLNMYGVQVELVDSDGDGEADSHVIAGQEEYSYSQLISICGEIDNQLYEIDEYKDIYGAPGSQYNFMYNVQDFCDGDLANDQILYELALIQGVPTTPEQDENRRPETLSIKSFFAKAFDALAGIALYPLRVIILVIGGIFNQIVGGIANLGGEAEEATLISLQDIIYTTATQSEDGVPIVAIDFFNITDGTSWQVEQIRQGIANWFYVFRNLSIVISLCILIYTGVRMAISSIAEDKAKYKSMLTNWAVQMVLVFFMQYIIFFTIGLNNGIVDSLYTGTQADKVDYMDQLYQQAWTSLSLSEGFGSAIVYCILLGMTFSFLILYIKRMITIGFLIVISPLVTVTYAIDKMGDSKSQALNTWLKEFVYNVLIQPFHCIIYSIFVSTAMDLLTGNSLGNLGAPVFAILCIMFMNKAEDILRKIFAFDKNAKSLGSGLASAAMLGAGISTVSSMFNKEESTQKKNAGTGEGMPDMVAMRENQATQNAKDKQIEEVQKQSEQASQQASSDKDITNAARQIEKSRRKNRAIESWQNAGGVAGAALKGAELTAKASLPVFTALLGAGQGNLKSAVATGTAGYAMGKGIENAIENKAKPSQAEISRQARANEKVFEEVYKEQEQKWTKEGGKWSRQINEKWEKFSQEEIANDTRRILEIKDLNSIEDKDERQWASIVHALNDTYKSLGYNNSEGNVVEVVRRMKSK